MTVDIILQDGTTIALDPKNIDSVNDVNGICIIKTKDDKTHLAKDSYEDIKRKLSEHINII